MSIYTGDMPVPRSHAMRITFLTLLSAILYGCPDEPGVPPPAEEDPACEGGRRRLALEIDIPFFRDCQFNADCSDGIFCNGQEVCRSRDDDGVTRCECQPPPEDTIPCNDERATCDEVQNACLWECMIEPDADNDGVWNTECGGSDCDDNDADRFPGNPEVCDVEGHDEDCDPTTFGERDIDQDGFFDMQCFNVDGASGRDCDDRNPAAHPIQNEVCNSIDDDCDGDVDENVSMELYVDNDGDGFGTGEPILGCAPMSGYALQGGDCIDKLATIFPGTITCDESDPQFPNRFNKCALDGTWTPGVCEAQRLCIPQPDGTGVCI